MDDEHATEILIRNFCRPSVASIFRIFTFVYDSSMLFSSWKIPPQYLLFFEKTVIVISLNILAHYSSCDSTASLPRNLQAAIGAYYDFESPNINAPCMSFVRDVTIGEGESVPPDTPFTKTWRIQNTGLLFILIKADRKHSWNQTCQ